MASITTLVDDIYKFVDSGKISEQGTKEIAEEVAKLLSRRLSGEADSPRYLRASNLSSVCGRKLWLDINSHATAEPLDPVTKLKFLIGDLLEIIMLGLTKESGHEVTAKGKEVDVHGVKGHIDAVVDGVLVDTKTASGRGFYKFKNHKLESDDPFGYIDQLNLYLEGMKDDPDLKIKGQGGFLVFNKESGELHLDLYRKQTGESLEQRVDDVRAMLSNDEPPRRPYSPVPDGRSGNAVIPNVPCGYCGQKKECWKDSNDGAGLRTYSYAGGPRHFTRVVRDPLVPARNHSDPF